MVEFIITLLAAVGLVVVVKWGYAIYYRSTQPRSLSLVQRDAAKVLVSSFIESQDGPSTSEEAAYVTRAILIMVKENEPYCYALMSGRMNADEFISRVIEEDHERFGTFKDL